MAPPPISALLSLLLIAGCDAIGTVALRAARIESSNSGWKRTMAPVAGAMVLAVILYPLALAALTPLLFLRAVAYVVAGVGLFRAVRLIAATRKLRADISAWTAQSKLWTVLLLFLLAGFALIALAPVTNADSLDYHVGMAISLLNNGAMPVSPEWFSGRLSGNGEVLNALGLAIGAEQFGALLQFAGLGAIAGLFIGGESTEPESVDGRRVRLMIAAAALSAPVLIELVSSSKPQLLPVAMTTCAFALVFFPSRRTPSREIALPSFALICLLVATAAQMKLSYMLGGGILGLFAFALMVRQKLTIQAIAIGVVTVAAVFGPPLAWKHHYFGAGIVDGLTKPLPGGWPGSVEFESLVRNFRESPVRFPLSMILPSGIGTITTVLGFSPFVLVALRAGRDRWIWTAIAASLLVAGGTALLGSPNSRSYLEPFFWLLLIVAIAPRAALSPQYRWMKWPVALQAAGTSALLWYGVFALSPGALTRGLRSRVMSHAANGYSAMAWADSVLPATAVFLNGTRSMALAPRDAVSSDWTGFVDPVSPAAAPYLQQLIERRVSYIMLIGDHPEPGKFAGCVGPETVGPGIGHTATRNPFNTGAAYKVWLVSFHADRLPGCLTAR